MTRGMLSGGVCTDIFEDADRYTCVKYHKTPVVRFNPFEIILDSGGWMTVTTKRRMNQASREFNLGYNVFAVRSEWYINFKDKSRIEFFDGVTLVRKERPDVAE